MQSHDLRTEVVIAFEVVGNVAALSTLTYQAVYHMISETATIFSVFACMLTLGSGTSNRLCLFSTRNTAVLHSSHARAPRRHANAKRNLVPLSRRMQHANGVIAALRVCAPCLCVVAPKRRMSPMAEPDTVPAAADDAAARANDHPSSPPGITSDSLAPDTSEVTGEDATDGSTPDPTAAAEAMPTVANGNAAVAAGQEAAADETAGRTAISESADDAAVRQPAAAYTASAQAAADPELATEQQPLSKNQQKKLRKMQR